MPGSDSPPDAFLAFQYGYLDNNEPLQGESVDRDFLQWFVLQSYSLSLNGYTPPGGSGGGGDSSGGGGGGGAGAAGEKPFPPIEITMATQIGSPWLMKLCTQFASGKPDALQKLKIPSAYICVRRPGAGGPFANEQKAGSFLILTLEGITIASYKTDISCQDTISLNYESLTIEYWRVDPHTGVIMEAPTDDAPVIYQTRTWSVGDSSS